MRTNLHWITRHFKQFSVPQVVEVENCSVDAYYDTNIGSVCVVGNQEVYNSCGLIVVNVSSNLPEETLLLHEYRHHIQVSLHGIWKVPDWQNGESLEVYHRDNVFERDARLFEVSLGRTDEVTGYYRTQKISRSIMLSLPTSRFLASLPIE